MKSFYFLAFLLLSLTSLAQVSDCHCYNIKPHTVGCAPFDIEVEDCTGKKLVDLWFEPNTPPSSVTTHTYQLPGEYYVVQGGNFGCGSVSFYKKDSTKVTVKPSITPDPEVYACAGNKALINTPLHEYDEYLISDGSGKNEIVLKGESKILEVASYPLTIKGNYTGAKNCNAQTTYSPTGTISLSDVSISRVNVLDSGHLEVFYNGLPELFYEFYLKSNTDSDYNLKQRLTSGTASYIIKGLDSTKTYCIKIRSADRCSQTGSFSNEVCTIRLTGTAVPEANNLSWIRNNEFKEYKFLVNDQENNKFPNQPVTNSFTDTNIRCANNYCYNIVSFSTENAVSYSNKVCLSAISQKKPASIADLNSTVTSNRITLNWPQNPSEQADYAIYISSNKVQYNYLSSSKSAVFSDPVSNPSSLQYCYKVNFTDKCGNAADLSNPTCPVLLKGTVPDALNRNLAWEPYTGFPEGIREYVVEKTDDAGNPYFSITAGTSLNYTDKGLDTSQQILKYRIKVISNTGRESLSNIWEAYQKGNFNLPTAFTPNGDGLNDTFSAVGLFITDFSMEIWNRNGEGVFSTSNFREGWNGRINGTPAPADTYMYKVEAKDRLGNTYKRNGSLQLIK